MDSWLFESLNVCISGSHAQPNQGTKPGQPSTRGVSPRVRRETRWRVERRFRDSENIATLCFVFSYLGLWSIIAKKHCHFALIWWVLIDGSEVSANQRQEVKWAGQWEAEKIAQPQQRDGLWLICFLLFLSIIILPEYKTWKYDNILSVKYRHAQEYYSFLVPSPQSSHFPPLLNAFENYKFWARGN